MKKTVAISVLFCCSLAVWAQVNFKTIVPQRPVVVGESFQVQYTISNAEKVSSFNALSSFEPFRFVSGPDIYNGKMAGVNAMHLIKNYVFTLEAIWPGYFTIDGARATIDGKVTTSNPVIVEVISKEEAASRYTPSDNSAYLLRPGEDPYKKISQNLFLKVMVNKKNCYAGEPVLATFKLYSRLQSKSDIVKNPGFYGFTVYDMVNLDDKQVSTEKVNGKIFDVHTIRKVQLFPLQSGIFTIDAMEVKNKVEFSKSRVSKKNEQEIAEGVLNSDNDEPLDENAEVFETTMRTEPVIINVKPAPAAVKPPGFNGATGLFTISSSLPVSTIAKNKGGFFDVIITGQGNFTQLNEPVVDWPDGIEGFDPIILDSLDKSKFPLTGSRKYHYGFICSNPGRYQLPPIHLTFFNPSLGSYKTISSMAIELEVGNEEKANIITEKKKISITEKNAKASRTAVIIIVSILIGVLIYWIRYKREPVKKEEEKKNVVLPSVDELLAPAQRVVKGNDKDFYSSLHQCTWNFLMLHFNLSGSDISKRNLLDTFIARHVDEIDARAIISSLEHCETDMFTNVVIQENKEVLLKQVKDLLEKVSRQLF